MLFRVNEHVFALSFFLQLKQKVLNSIDMRLLSLISCALITNDALILCFTFPHVFIVTMNTIEIFKVQIIFCELDNFFQMLAIAFKSYIKSIITV